MIIPDINLLLYAYDEHSPFHGKAARWWSNCLSGEETVGLPPVVLFGFVRIATNPRVFQQPMAPDDAAGHVRSWLARPCAQVLDAPADHVAEVLKLIEGIGTAGNLVADAQIAALAIANRAVLHTADSDFLRFPGLQWLNPITGASSPKVQNA
jgi:toxin-antitoxin system PIN domain toxin